MTKYGFDDARPVLERASARETASRVVLGTVAKAFLAQAFDVAIVSHVVALGAVEAPEDELPGPGDLERVDASPVRAFTDAATAAMVAEVDAAQTRRRHARRRGRGDRLRAAGRDRLATCSPTAGSTPGWPGR